MLDVASALICAPEAASWDNGGTGGFMGQPLQRRMNLREALKAEAENAPKVHKTDPVHAEHVVRLYRKVEAQLVMPQQIDALGGLDQALGAGALDVDSAMANVGLSDGLGGTHGLDDVMGSGEDLMSGLMGNGHGGGLLDSFGTGGDMGDGMGF